ncbi:MAG: transposase, partial [Candidatus Sabulitectum sp.]|nr:transposase [Candidatus Sabulitectum sp.]
MTALAIGQRTLPTYAHRFAPKTFTQPQLLACLVLMRFHKADFRGIVAILQDNPSLCDALQLKRVPHFTTLHKAYRRLIRMPVVRQLFSASAKLLLGRKRTIPQAAADSSGFESSRISPYFVRRRQRGQKDAENPLYTTTTYSHFPKGHIIADCDTHLVLACYPKRGPTPDIAELDILQTQLAPGFRLLTLFADAGYDSESNHVMLRDYLGIRSVIPPKHGRPSTKPAKGKYRRLMQRQFKNVKRTGYGQRWQAETVFSMMKRNLGHAVHGRSYHAHNRDILLHCITHNAMILRRQSRGFLQS